MPEKLYIAGKWSSGGSALPVHNKFNGTLLGEVATARADDVEAALASAAQAFETTASLPAHRRAEILRAIAGKLIERKENLAHTIAQEAGKGIKLARGEVDRAAQTLNIAAEEATRIHGETVPLDAVPSGEGYFGFYQRRPIGPVVAITPFNFPLNLVCHKLAPALAAGNSFILKPAEQTPLTAVRLFEILDEVGLPPGAVNLLQGDGETVGDALVTDARVRKVSFTGSRAVGEIITRRAGIKKVTLELGNTSPVIVAPDADLDTVARRCAFGAYVYSGQVCISVQRLYGAPEIYDELKVKMGVEAQGMKVGDPLDEDTLVGPMIDEAAALRVSEWVDEARTQGAELVTGGHRDGAVYHPTLLAEVTPQMRVSAQEVFGPVAGLQRTASFEDALKQANDSEYGLQASVFTRDIDRVLHAIKKLDFGGVVINDFPTFRADHMPYGGNRQSGLGREGLKFAIEDMTNLQMVVIKSPHA